MIFAVLCLFILLYWMCEAVTEVMVWKSNHVSLPILSGKYHTYRWFEGMGISGAILFAFSFGFFVSTNYFLGIVGISGAWLFGWSVYEGVFSSLAGYGLWHKPYPYPVTIFGKTFTIMQ